MRGEPLVYEVEHAALEKLEREWKLLCGSTFRRSLLIDQIICVWAMAKPLILSKQCCPILHSYQTGSPRGIMPSFGHCKSCFRTSLFLVMRLPLLVDALQPSIADYQAWERRDYQLPQAEVVVCAHGAVTVVTWVSILVCMMLVGINLGMTQRTTKLVTAGSVFVSAGSVFVTAGSVVVTVLTWVTVFISVAVFVAVE